MIVASHQWAGAGLGIPQVHMYSDPMDILWKSLEILVQGSGVECKLFYLKVTCKTFKVPGFDVLTFILHPWRLKSK